MKDSRVFQITAVSSVVLFLAVLLTGSAASVEWNVYENNSVTIDQANSTIVWGQNYTFNASELNLYNQTLQINRTNTTENYNISIASNTTEEINSTLHKYNLTDNPELGKTVLKIETEATNNSKVNFSFTGIPGVGSERYVLRRDGNEFNTFSSGGKISWSYSNWNSKHNFSLTYEQKPEEDAGGKGDDSDDDSGGGGGTTIDDSTDSHSWSFTDKNRFTFDSTDEKLGVQEVSVQTRENQSSFEITVEKLEESSSAPEIDNSYSVYSINTSVTDSEIESITLEFMVNRSFAQQYDKIIVSRYDSNSWNELPTKPVETEGEKWTYQASTTGFSYYAVTGQNTQTEQNETDQATENDTSEQQREQREDEVNQGRQNAQETLQNANSTIQQGEPGYQLLQQARTAFQNQDYTEVQNLAQQALKQNQRQTQEGLPWIKIIGAATLLIIVLSGGYMLHHRKR